MKDCAGYFVIWLTATAGPVAAEIHEYMILRLVYLNTSCGTQSLERLETGPAYTRFKVTCRNVSAYPDGLTVLCTDPDDDRACLIETKEKSFDSLDLMRPSRGEQR